MYVILLLLRSQAMQLKKTVSDERHSHNKTQLRLSRSESRLQTQSEILGNRNAAHERLRELFVSLVSFQSLSVIL